MAKDFSGTHTHTHIWITESEWDTGDVILFYWQCHPQGSVTVAASTTLQVDNVTFSTLSRLNPIHAVETESQERLLPTFHGPVMVWTNEDSDCCYNNNTDNNNYYIINRELWVKSKQTIKSELESYLNQIFHHIIISYHIESYHQII